MCLSETDSVISMDEDNDDVDNCTKMSNTLLDSDILKCDDFIIVKFPQKKYDIHFVGQIIKLTSQNEMEVKFLRKIGEKFSFPLMEDVSLVLREDIVACLQPPKIIKGTTRISSRYTFNYCFENLKEVR